jgi:hypothetical protein
LVLTQNHKANHQHYLLRVKIEHLIEYSYRKMELSCISNKSFKAASQNQHQVGNCIKRMGTYIDEFSVTLREYVIKEYNTKNNRLGNCFRYFIVSSSVYMVLS